MEATIRKSRKKTVSVKDLKIEYFRTATQDDPFPEQPKKYVTFTVLGAVREWTECLTYRQFRQLNPKITVKG